MVKMINNRNGVAIATNFNSSSELINPNWFDLGRFGDPATIRVQLHAEWLRTKFLKAIVKTNLNPQLYAPT